MKQPQQQRADETRRRILEAAIQEFSEHGLAGARTSTIAAVARVNKALLYYYFRDKEALYTAALEAVAGKVAESGLALLTMECSAGERLLRFALQHFDRILSQRGFQQLMQREMMRHREGRSSALRILAKKAFEPMFAQAQAVVEEGVRQGELCAVDWMQMMCAMLGANVFYFLSAPMVQQFAERDPLERGAIAERRTAAIEFLGQAIFVDRRHGASVARRVLAAAPLEAFAERKTA